MSTSSGTRRAPDDLVVVYRRGVGLERWRERHASSPVPGAWPYGLDRLAEHLSAVRAVDVPSVSALRTCLTGRAGLWRRGIDSVPRAALAWDETSAVDMVRSQRADRYFAGVIWATDTLASQGESRQLRVFARVLRRLDGLWVLSRPQAESVRSWLGRRCPPIYFLPFGVDPTFYAPGAAPPSNPHVVSVGGDRDRDPATLFAALGLVREARPDVRVTVQSRTGAAAPPGVTKVERLPHIEVANLLRSASVVALATRPNLHASGMTVGLEAQASGVPVVACDTPGMRDYFSDGVTGRLVPPSAPETMASAILKLLEDPLEARAMGAAGRDRVLSAHSVSTMAASLADIVRGSAKPL